MKLGYIFSPPSTAGRCRHRRLDIKIHEHPTLQHFDPEMVQYTVYSPAHEPKILKIRHPWEGKDSYRVIATNIILIDRKEEVVEAFTFGGDLQIISDFNSTVCLFQSPAPILPMFDYSSISTILADEAQILLAEMRALWEKKKPKQEYEDQISRIDPFDLYLACLEALNKRCLLFKTPKPEHIQKLLHFLRNERITLNNQHNWPLYVPSLEKLFSFTTTPESQSKLVSKPDRQTGEPRRLICEARQMVL